MAKSSTLTAGVGGAPGRTLAWVVALWAGALMASERAILDTEKTPG